MLLAGLTIWALLALLVWAFVYAATRNEGDD